MNSTKSIKTFNGFLKNESVLLEKLQNIKDIGEFAETYTKMGNEYLQERGIPGFSLKDILYEISSDKKVVTKQLLKKEDFDEVAGHVHFKLGTSTSNWTCCGGSCN